MCPATTTIDGFDQLVLDERCEGSYVLFMSNALEHTTWQEGTHGTLTLETKKLLGGDRPAFQVCVRGAYKGSFTVKVFAPDTLPNNVQVFCAAKHWLETSAGRTLSDYAARRVAALFSKVVGREALCGC